MSNQKPLLTPYRSIGLFVDENKPAIFNAGKKSFMLTSTSHSFKLYKLPEMKIKLLGPNLPNKIRAVAAHNENIFLASGKNIYHFQNYHMVSLFEKSESKITAMLNIGQIIIFTNEDGQVISFDFANPEENISEFSVDFVPTHINHPPTYLNKILIMGEKNLELRNIRTTKCIYNFTQEDSTLGEYLRSKTGQTIQGILSEELKGSKKHKGVITTSSNYLMSIENSPALDVVGLGLSNGEILLFNLKQDKVSLKFQIKDCRPVSLSFSQTDLPFLAVGDDRGQITIFNLNEQRIASVMKDAHKERVNFVHFLTTELILMSGSFHDNSLVMRLYDELESSKFRIVKKIGGLTAPIRKLGFLGDEGYHVVASSFSNQAELKDFFIWNEAFEGGFSLKQNKKLVQNHLNTESMIEISQITDFSFSTTRAKDWSNLISAHKNNEKPFMWSTEDHTIVKKDIKWLDNADRPNSQITKVYLTSCGNFGIIGYENGVMAKVNMQSGTFRGTFQYKGPQPSSLRQEDDLSIESVVIHQKPISGLFVDSYNRVLVSSDNTSYVANWDFYTGKLARIISVAPQKVSNIKNSRSSNLFCVILDNNVIEVYDQYTLKKARTFSGHTNRIMDACFTVNNKQVISSSLDCTLKIWDIISGTIVNNLKLKNPIVSMDFDPSGEFLVSAFANSKELFIWSNRIGKELMGDEEEIPIKFVSQIKKREWGHSRARYLSKNGIVKKEEDVKINVSEKEVNDFKKFLEGCSERQELEEKASMVGLFEQDIGKWVPLMNIDEIKEKNKPKKQAETNVQAPFFLVFDKRQTELDRVQRGDTVDPDELGKKETEEQKKEKVKEQSRIMKKGDRNKFLEEVGSNIETLINKINKCKNKGEEGYTEEAYPLFDQLFKEMKKQTPSQLDYEIRKATFGNMPNIIGMVYFYKYILDNPREYDIKQIFFNNFLHINSDILIANTEQQELIAEMKEKVGDNWQSLDDKIQSNVCMVEHFAKIKN